MASVVIRVSMVGGGLGGFGGGAAGGLFHAWHAHSHASVAAAISTHTLSHLPGIVSAMPHCKGWGGPETTA